MPNIKFMLTCCFSTIWLICTEAQEINEVLGTNIHGEILTIYGNSFGNKETPYPFRSSYHNAVQSMNFQESGTFDENWGTAGTPLITLQENFIRLKKRQYIQLEYSSRGNWGDVGYSAGLQTSLPMTGADYIAYWEYLPENIDFSLMSTGNVNIKYIYIAPGQSLHTTVCVNDEGQHIFAGCHLDGETHEEQNANLILPFGGGFYARPYSWTANYTLPRGK